MHVVADQMRMVRTPKKRTRACLLCCTISISHKSCSVVGGMVTIGRCRSKEPILSSHRCAVGACACLAAAQRQPARNRRQHLHWVSLWKERNHDSTDVVVVSVEPRPPETAVVSVRRGRISHRTFSGPGRACNSIHGSHNPVVHSAPPKQLKALIILNVSPLLFHHAGLR